MLVASTKGLNFRTKERSHVPTDVDGMEYNINDQYLNLTLNKLFRSLILCSLSNRKHDPIGMRSTVLNHSRSNQSLLFKQLYKVISVTTTRVRSIIIFQDLW